MFKKILRSQKNFYTYTLAYPDEMGGHVFYVGKGTGNRMLTHEQEARRGYTDRKHDAIREIWNNGYQVKKTIEYETDIELDCLIFEWAGINMIWASPYLTNAVSNVCQELTNPAELKKGPIRQRNPYAPNRDHFIDQRIDHTVIRRVL